MDAKLQKKLLIWMWNTHSGESDWNSKSGLDDEISIGGIAWLLSPILKMAAFMMDAPLSICFCCSATTKLADAPLLVSSTSN